MPYNISAIWVSYGYQLNVSWNNPYHEAEWCRYYPETIIASFDLVYKNNEIGNRTHLKQVDIGMQLKNFLIETNFPVSYMCHWTNWPDYNNWLVQGRHKSSIRDYRNLRSSRVR